jgi:hypothetical protein
MDTKMRSNVKKNDSASQMVSVCVPHAVRCRAIASERRAERLDAEYKQAVEAEKVSKAVDALEIELYNKRARQRTIELEIFNNTKHFDKYV